MLCGGALKERARRKKKRAVLYLMTFKDLYRADGDLSYPRSFLSV
jgi:hypothetical protein